MELPAASNPRAELYRHALRRILTEWGVFVVNGSFYAGPATGDRPAFVGRSQPLGEIVGDEPLGICRLDAVQVGTVSQVLDVADHHQGDRQVSQNILRLRHLNYVIELTYTFSRVLWQVHRWNSHLDEKVLIQLFGPRPKAIAA